MKQVYNQLRLGLNIRLRRHLKKMTQAQFAEKIGCSVASVSAMERGKKDISVEQLYLVSRALACTISDLLQNV